MRSVLDCFGELLKVLVEFLLSFLRNFCTECFDTVWVQVPVTFVCWVTFVCGFVLEDPH